MSTPEYDRIVNSHWDGRHNEAAINASKKLREEKRQGNVRTWTNEELYSGMDRNDTKRAVAGDQLSPYYDGLIRRAIQGGARRSAGEQARLEDQYRSSSDSLRVLDNERRRRSDEAHERSRRMQ